jgi:hypothetical protein
MEEGFDLNSGHSPIYLAISDKIIMKNQNPVLTNKQTGISTIYWRVIVTYQYRLKLLTN